MADYFDRAGQPISEGEFTRKYGSDYHAVAFTDLPGRWVSTIWRGTRPGLFETMRWPDRTTQRYETEAEAMAGHRAMVEEESK